MAIGALVRIAAHQSYWIVCRGVNMVAFLERSVPVSNGLSVGGSEPCIDAVSHVG